MAAVKRQKLMSDAYKDRSCNACAVEETAEDPIDPSVSIQAGKTHHGKELGLIIIVSEFMN